MKVQLITHTPDVERVVATAAKLCYSPVGVDQLNKKMSDAQANSFIEKLMSIGHESPIEHVSFTFAVEGVSRVFSHQLVRHRLASYSQQSQRYVKLDQFEYIIPDAIKNCEKTKELFMKAMEEDQKYYDKLVETILYRSCVDYMFDNNIYGAGINIQATFDAMKAHDNKKFSKFEKKAIEDARFVFPNACETKVVFTMNARSLMHFFKHRCCDRAQWEIRAVANEMVKLVQEVSPTLFKYAGASCVTGKCPEGSMSCGNPKTLIK